MLSFLGVVVTGSNFLASITPGGGGGTKKSAVDALENAKQSEASSALHHQAPRTLQQQPLGGTGTKKKGKRRVAAPSGTSASTPTTEKPQQQRARRKKVPGRRLRQPPEVQLSPLQLDELADALEPPSHGASSVTIPQQITVTTARSYTSTSSSLSETRASASQLSPLQRTPSFVSAESVEFSQSSSVEATGTAKWARGAGSASAATPSTDGNAPSVAATTPALSSSFRSAISSLADFASAAGDLDDLHLRLHEVSLSMSSSLNELSDLAAAPSSQDAPEVAAAESSSHHTWQFYRQHLLTCESSSLSTPDVSGASKESAALTPVCTITSFLEFRRYWSVVCNMDSSMIGYVLQMARDDLESVPLYGSWLLRFSSEPELVASVWSDVLLAMMGFADDSDHPLLSTAASAELFLGSDSCCLRIWSLQTPQEDTVERIRTALSLSSSVLINFEAVTAL